MGKTAKQGSQGLLQYPVLPGLSDTTPSLLRLATSALDLGDLGGLAPSLCLMLSLPSLPLHPKTFEFSGFCLIYLLLDLLTHTVDPVLAAPWEVELITLEGSLKVHVRLKAAFCCTINTSTMATV